MDRALALQSQGDKAGAIAEFKAAYQLRQFPRILANIAGLSMDIGNAPQAVEYCKRYLAEPDDESREKVEAMCKRAQQRLDAMQEPPERSLRPVASPAPPLFAVASPPPPTPVYKRWWFWTAIGVVAAGAVAGGVAYGVTRPQNPIDVEF